MHFVVVAVFVGILTRFSLFAFLSRIALTRSLDCRMCENKNQIKFLLFTKYLDRLLRQNETKHTKRFQHPNCVCVCEIRCKQTVSIVNCVRIRKRIRFLCGKHKNEMLKRIVANRPNVLKELFVR